MQSEMISGIGKPTSLPVTFTSANGVHWHCVVSLGKPIALTATRPEKEIKKGGFLGWLTKWPKDDLFLDSIGADPAGWASFALDIWRACIITQPRSMLGDAQLVPLEKVRDRLAGRAPAPNKSPNSSQGNVTKEELLNLKMRIGEIFEKLHI